MRKRVLEKDKQEVLDKITELNDRLSILNREKNEVVNQIQELLGALKYITLKLEDGGAK